MAVVHGDTYADLREHALYLRQPLVFGIKPGPA